MWRLCGLLAVLAGPAAGQILEATYLEPTDRYPHAVLGDDLEWGALAITDAELGRRVFRLPEVLVFEDVAPRLADVTGDGAPEVVVVESHQRQGARLAVYSAAGRIGQTPFIGTRFRWLAPVAVADLDGDGHVELAYVDRPHLARVLRVWRWRNGALAPVASAEGHTNHRIGEPDIAGGLRDCGAGPELVTARGDWQVLLATRLEGDRLVSREIGPHSGRGSFAAALACAE